MIFLIEYDRLKGIIINKYEFTDSDRIKAEEKRLEIEIDLNRKKVTHEVVLLEAVDENLLRHTHRRYFESLNTIAVSTGTSSLITKIEKKDNETK